MSAAARSLLIDLDKGLVRMNAQVFPHPADVKAAVETARDLLATLAQEIEELEARLNMKEEEA